MLKQAWGGVLQVSNARSPGANLLQITWEHMTLLPVEGLVKLRDMLLKCLGQHWRWTHPVRETEDNYLLPLVRIVLLLISLPASMPLVRQRLKSSTDAFVFWLIRTRSGVPVRQIIVGTL